MLTQPKRSVRLALWTTLLLSIIGVLGYLGWQLYGTNYVSRQVQERTADELTAVWSADATPRVVSADPKPATSSDRGPARAAPTPAPQLGEAYALVRVPRFGDDYEVPLLEGVRERELAAGYGHIPATAQLGSRGNFVIAGHRVTNGEPLREMPKLRPGDKVIVESRRAIYTYRLDTDPNGLIVDFQETWVLHRRPANPDPGGLNPARGHERLLTLVTCSELFHTDNRMIAFAHLAGVEMK